MGPRRHTSRRPGTTSSLWRGSRRRPDRPPVRRHVPAPASQVASSREYRLRSEATMAALVMLIAVAALGLIPHQSTPVLGAELVVAFAVFLAFYAVRSRVLGRGTPSPKRRAQDRAGCGHAVGNRLWCAAGDRSRLGEASRRPRVPRWRGTGDGQHLVDPHGARGGGAPAPTERPTSLQLPGGQDPAGS